MKTALVALGVGIGVEAALVAALSLGGFGPCGPASPLSAIVLWIHTPGLHLTQALHIPESRGIILILAAYTMFWSVLAYLILDAWLHRKN